MSKPKQGPGARAVLRHRNFALLWSGQTVSLAGNGAFMVALPLEVLHLTGSPFELALIISSQTISMVILLLIGGALTDRLSRRLVMLISDTVCGVSVSFMAVLIAVREARLWELLVLSIIFGAVNAFFRPASTAIVRDIVPSELLVSASSLSSLSQSLAQLLLGPLFGGIVVAASGTAWAFALDGASFAVSAACLAAMRNISELKGATSSRLLAGVAEGLRFCYSQRWLACSITMIAVINLVCFVPFFILGTLLVKNIFHAGPIALGALYAGSGVGGVIASLVAARRGSPLRRVATIWTAWAVSGICAASVGLSPWLWMSVMLAGMMWGLGTYGNILWFPLIQKETPPELLGRVSSVDWLFSFALSPLGALAAGAAVEGIGVRLTLIAGGVITAAAGWILFIPGVMDPDKQGMKDPPEMAAGVAPER